MGSPMPARIRAFLLALALSLPALAADDTPGSILLVARKDLPDPFFRDSVVLVTHRLGPVPVGVIVNRPTGVPVSRVVKDVEGLPENATVFFGGPVGRDGLVLVYRASAGHKDATEVLKGVHLTSNGELVKSVLAREKSDSARLYAGYAAWSPGQLENEIARGDWYLVPADPETIFDSKPEALWRLLERRAAGKKA